MKFILNNIRYVPKFFLIILYLAASACSDKDVKPFALVVGVPGIQIGWMSEYGERIDLPTTGSGSWECKKTRTIYNLKRDILTKI